MMEARRFWSIDELLAAYRRGECRPIEVVQESLAIIKQWEPILNAFISVYPEESVAVAAEVSGAHGLLSGVPVALKDLVDVKGRRTTNGSRIRTDFVSTFDAPVWEKLRSHKAVLVGKTNMLEFAYGVPHPDYGQTNNPYHPARTSGGSSGGSAAAVATGAVYAAIGTDTGGSIRIPAAYCGVVGLKPTYGCVSSEGVFPLSWSLDHVGPIARSAKDVARVMEVLVGEQPNPSAGFLVAVEQSSEVERVGYLPEQFLPYTHPDMKRAYQEALHTLRGLGVQLVPLTAVEVQLMSEAESVLMKVLLAEAAQIHRPWWDRASDYAPLTWEQISEGQKVHAVDYLQGLKEQRDIRSAVAGWFSEFDVLVTPTVDFPAPLEDPAIGDVEMDEMRYTGPFNVSGNPAVTVPCGVSADGLPLGLQLVGPLFEDARLLRFVHDFETAHPRIAHPQIAHPGQKS